MHLWDNSEPKAIFSDIKCEANASLQVFFILFIPSQHEHTQHI